MTIDEKLDVVIGTGQLNPHRMSLILTREMDLTICLLQGAVSETRLL
jgi:hypothetical protein